MNDAAAIGACAQGLIARVRAGCAGSALAQSSSSRPRWCRRGRGCRDRSTSSLVMRKQPDDTAWPIVSGSLEPWMRYSVEPRYIARAPSGLSTPPAMWRGRSGRRAQHLRRRRPARPFLLGGDAVGAAPAEAVAADADAVAQRLAVAEHEIEPSFGGVDVDGAGRVIAGEHSRSARGSGSIRRTPRKFGPPPMISRMSNIPGPARGRRRPASSPPQTAKQKPGSSFPRENRNIARDRPQLRAISQATSP